MSRNYAVIVVLSVLFFIRALGGNDNANTPVDDEFDSDYWQTIELLVGVASFFFVALLVLTYTLPPPPLVDATASVDELDPSTGIPNQFIRFARSGKIGSDSRGIDDGISPNSEERRVKWEIAVLRAQLERMKTKDQHRSTIEAISSVIILISIAGLIWATRPQLPPPPPVDATASVDELEPSLGIPNQFIGFARSGKIGFRGIDDGISPTYERRKVKSELAVLRAELDRMKKENQHLRDLLNQVTNNYYTLQTNLFTLMQQQNQKVAIDELEQADDHKVDQVVRQHSTSGTNMLLRQFIDLGLGGPINAETEQEPSLSMLEGSDPS